MTKSFLTHFSTMTIFHGLILLAGLTVVQTQLPNEQVAKLGNGGTGNGIMRMKVAHDIFMRPALPKTKSESKFTRPTPKKVATAPAVAKPAQAAPVASNEPTGGNDPKGTGLSKAGVANGSEFGTSATGKTDIISKYKAELRARIEQNKSYPPMSKRLGQTGTVVIAFTLLEDGRITDAKIETPSRYERLNASALEAVQKVEKFKPIPKEAGENKIEFKVPVKFMTI
ncbi:cell envelope integrity protein TolA [Peredibacter sp. HCB2-198]|uniref:cell envelope integrity protein TolA n=1 Tax=Peredibacter sp. HCB2-198 TaxID=3383025 RepID=UPI0038B5F900